MGVREAYEQWAATYDSDRNLTRDLDQEITRRTLAGTRCASILELGCGTGKSTAFLVQLGAHVHALDFSDAMLAQARAKLPGADVTFTVADLTEPWPCADRSADLIVCNLVLEHIADLRFIFAEAFRCLEQGGRMFVSELHPFKQYLGGQAVFQREEGPVSILAHVHHISDFLDAAAHAGLRLAELREWWHADDRNAPPRIVSFLFQKP